MIAFVVFFVRVGNGGKKSEANGVKGAHELALLNYTIETVIPIDKPPVIHLSVLHHSLYDIGRRIIHGKRINVGIPKQVGRKTVDTILTTHRLTVRTF